MSLRRTFWIIIMFIGFALISTNLWIIYITISFGLLILLFVMSEKLGLGDRTERASRYISDQVKQLVLDRQGHKCANPTCGNEEHLQFHHSIPISQGGTSDIMNIIAICPNCHSELTYG